MPRKPKENKRKTEFKEPNIKKYDYILNGYKTTLGFLIIVILIVVIFLLSKNNSNSAIDIFSKAFFLAIGTFIGRITKK